jgi:hypothetical protein
MDMYRTISYQKLVTKFWQLMVTVGDLVSFNFCVVLFFYRFLSLLGSL